MLALYRGPSVAEAKIIAVSVDPDLVSYVAGRLLASRAAADDPVLAKLDQGRRGALRAIQREADAEDDVQATLKVIRREAETAGLPGLKSGEDQR